MGYLLAEILACLLLAGLVGVFVGWWLRGGCSNKLKEQNDSWELKFKDNEIDHETKTRSLISKYDAKIKSEHDFYNSKIKNMESSYNLKYKTEQNEKEALKAELISTKTELSNIKDTLDLKLKDSNTKSDNQIQTLMQEHKSKSKDSEDKIQKLKIELEEAKNALERSNKTWEQMLKDTEAKWENKTNNLNHFDSSELEALKVKLEKKEKELQDTKKELENVNKNFDLKHEKKDDIIDFHDHNIKKQEIQKIANTNSSNKSNDLTKIDGISNEYAKILLAIGIDSKEKLDSSDAGRIYFEMTKYNQKHSIISEVPSVSRIQAWQNSFNQKSYTQTQKKELQECYNVEDIVGVGKTYARLLKNRGVKNTCVLASKYLTNNTATNKVAKKLNIDFDAIRSWASMSDLMRVPGIGSQYAYILHMVGISSRDDLKYSNATTLYNELVKYNGYSNVHTEVPALGMIQEWINFLHKGTSKNLRYS